MRIKMLKAASASDGTPLVKGKVYDVSLADFKRLIADEVAERVK